MLRLLKNLKRQVRCLFNHGKVNACGLNSVIDGYIDKRVEGAVIVVGNDCLIQGSLITGTAASSINIGNNVFIGGDSLLDCAQIIDIEDDVLISYGCLLMDNDGHNIGDSIRKQDLAVWKAGGIHDWSKTICKPIRISRGAWIGARASILKGVSIGEGAVIGTGSVVTRNVPAYTIVAGNPARVIREIPPEER